MCCRAIDANWDQIFIFHFREQIVIGFLDNITISLSFDSKKTIIFKFPNLIALQFSELSRNLLFHKDALKHRVCRNSLPNCLTGF